MLTVFILFWLVCSALTVSIWLGYNEYEYDRAYDDIGFIWFVSLLGGPIMFVIVLFMTNFAKHGFLNPFSMGIEYD